MKISFQATCLSLFAAVSLSACMNGDYDADPNNVNSAGNPLKTERVLNGTGTNDFARSGMGNLQVKIDGGVVNANDVQVTDLGGVTKLSAKIGNDQLEVSFPSNAGNNTTWDLTSSTVAHAGLVVDGAKFSTAVGKGGRVLLLENDAAHCSGTFYFDAAGKAASSETHAISEGVFHVSK
ncbi:MAG: hypothetical protein JST36_04840 [Bacteroidetes bacterium]|nr:hypothetical protein [Bacteroidota bacterium]